MATAEAALQASDEHAKANVKLAILELDDIAAMLDGVTPRDGGGIYQVAARVAVKRQQLAENPAAGSRFLEDVRFAAGAIEKLYELLVRREEAARMDLSALTKLPVAPVPTKDRTLSQVMEDVLIRLAGTTELEGFVTAWGPKNLGRLMLALDPIEIPHSVLGGGVLLKTFGIGRRTRALQLAQGFKALGSRFRERLYLVGAKLVLEGTAAALAHAEAAWKELLAVEANAEAWDRIRRRQKEILEGILGADPGLPLAVEEILAGLAAKSPSLKPLRLRDPNDIRGTEWDAWGKAYHLEAGSGDAAGSDAPFRAVTRILIERRGDMEPPRERVAAVLEKIYATWRARTAAD